MGNLLKIKAAFALFSLAAVAVPHAAAQSAANNMFVSGALKPSISVEDIADILAKYDIAGGIAPYEGDGTATLVAQSSGGAVMFVTFWGCDDPSAAKGCTAAMMYTGVSNAGLAYDDINTFNMSSDVTRAINLADAKMVMFDRSMMFNGGVTIENITYVTESFLMDVQRFLDSREFAATSIAMDAEPAPAGKLDNLSAGGNEAEFDLHQLIAKNARSAAVVNTWSVDFINDKD